MSSCPNCSVTTNQIKTLRGGVHGQKVREHDFEKHVTRKNPNVVGFLDSRPLDAGVAATPMLTPKGPEKSKFMITITLTSVAARM